MMDCINRIGATLEEHENLIQLNELCKLYKEADDMKSFIPTESCAIKDAPESMAMFNKLSLRMKEAMEKLNDDNKVSCNLILEQIG